MIARIGILALGIAAAAAFTTCAREEAAVDTRVSDTLEGWKDLAAAIDTRVVDEAARPSARCAREPAGSTVSERDMPAALACAFHASGPSGLSLSQFLDLVASLACGLGPSEELPRLERLPLRHPCLAEGRASAAGSNESMLVEIKEGDPIESDAGYPVLRVSIWDPSDLDFPRYLSFDHVQRPDGFELRFDDWKLLYDGLRAEVNAQTRSGSGSFVSFKIRRQRDLSVWDVVTINPMLDGSGRPVQARVSTYQGSPRAGFLSSVWDTLADSGAQDEGRATTTVMDHCWGGDASCPILSGPLFRNAESARALGAKWVGKPRELTEAEYLLRTREALTQALAR